MRERGSRGELLPSQERLEFEGDVILTRCICRTNTSKSDKLISPPQPKLISRNATESASTPLSMVVTRRSSATHRHSLCIRSWLWPGVLRLNPFATSTEITLTAAYARQDAFTPCLVICLDCARVKSKWIEYKDWHSSTFDQTLIFQTKPP